MKVLPRLAQISHNVTRSLLILLTLLAATGLLKARCPAQERVKVTAAYLDRNEHERVRTMAVDALERAEAGLSRRIERPLALTLVRRIEDLPPDVRPSFRAWTVALARTHQYSVWVVMDRVTAEPPDDLRTVLIHEFVHIVLGDMELALAKADRTLPVWLHEGLAQDVAGSIYMGGSDHILWFRAETDRLIPWRELRHGFPTDANEARIAYAQAASFLGYLRREVGRPFVLASAARFLSGEAESLDAAFAVDRDDSFTRRTGEWIRELLEGRGLLRYLRDNCFSVLMILAIPLLGFVMYKRLRREQRAGARLDAWEEEQQEPERREDPFA